MLRFQSTATYLYKDFEVKNQKEKKVQYVIAQFLIREENQYLVSARLSASKEWNIVLHYTREECVSEKETCSNVRLHSETSICGCRKEKSQCISSAC